MKKVVIEVFLLVVIAVVSSILIYNKYGKGEKIVLSTDEIKFKQEYEKLNGTKDTNDKKYNNVSIKENNGVIYVDLEEIKKVLKNKGVIYFGNASDLSSRSVVSVILDSADSTGIDNIYYFNTIDNNLNDEEKEELYKLLNIEKLDIPTVIFVLDGDIIGSHTGTVDDKEILNDEDKNKLASIYMKYMSQVSSGVCDEKC